MACSCTIIIVYDLLGQYHFTSLQPWTPFILDYLACMFTTAQDLPESIRYLVFHGINAPTFSRWLHPLQKIANYWRIIHYRVFSVQQSTVHFIVLANPMLPETRDLFPDYSDHSDPERAKPRPFPLYLRGFRTGRSGSPSLNLRFRRRWHLQWSSLLTVVD